MALVNLPKFNMNSRPAIASGKECALSTTSARFRGKNNLPNNVNNPKPRKKMAISVAQLANTADNTKQIMIGMINTVLFFILSEFFDRINAAMIENTVASDIKIPNSNGLLT